MALCAGRTWNIMEDYELLLVGIRNELNTTVLTDWATSSDSPKTPSLGDLLIDIREAAPPNGQLKDQPNHSKRTGPPYDFYSLHGTRICMGWFLPTPHDSNSHREVQDYGLDLYGLLMNHTNSAIGGLSDAGNVKTDLQSLCGAHKALTLMLTISVGAFGVFAFFTTWWAIYNPLKKRTTPQGRHKIIIWSHWIASMICGMLGFLSGLVGYIMSDIAEYQLTVSNITHGPSRVFLTITRLLMARIGLDLLTY
ncbi:hypothetical protein B0T21DRAFT_305710 [Apiosordaria backusii]|uniref:Uncharacterized protein n=1 Tax=Apiosordaria backusii TaxID=314023 RepID=A0AA40ELM3_9PEZI|nr:hypothetical protein B0T21DRAFT_305710 [Apiosordaria backusii]